jgi:hypothetical protein
MVIAVRMVMVLRASISNRYICTRTNPKKEEQERRIEKMWCAALFSETFGYQESSTIR